MRVHCSTFALLRKHQNIPTFGACLSEGHGTLNKYVQYTLLGARAQQLRTMTMFSALFCLFSDAIVQSSGVYTRGLRCLVQLGYSPFILCG